MWLAKRCFLVCGPADSGRPCFRFVRIRRVNLGPKRSEPLPSNYLHSVFEDMLSVRIDRVYTDIQLICNFFR